MRNVLLSFLIILSIPFATFAISLNEIQSAPDRYILIDENMENTFYLDINSIESIRYSPPYYTLRGEVYFVGYTRGLIAQQTTIFNYDYNRSFNSLMDKAHKAYPSYTDAQLLNMIEMQLNNDSGILLSVNKISYYYLNGQFITDGSFRLQGSEIPYGTTFHRIANFMFQKYYNLAFAPDL